MRTSSITLCLLILFFVGCSDDSAPPPDARADAGGDVASVHDLASGDTHADSASSDTRADSANNPDTLAGDIASGACAPLGANECFSNDDCLIERRCEEVDVGGGELWACCVIGARGTLEAGETCTDQNQCASAVCISVGTTMDNGRCSKPCVTAQDCPVGMQDCKLIAFSNSDTRWCFPEGQ